MERYAGVLKAIHRDQEAGSRFRSENFSIRVLKPEGRAHSRALPDYNELTSGACSTAGGTAHARISGPAGNPRTTCARVSRGPWITGRAGVVGAPVIVRPRLMRTEGLLVLPVPFAPFFRFDFRLLLRVRVFGFWPCVLPGFEPVPVELEGFAEPGCDWPGETAPPGLVWANPNEAPPTVDITANVTNMALFFI